MSGAPLVLKVPRKPASTAKTVKGGTCTSAIKWFPGVEMVFNGVFLPGVLIVAYDDDVPMNELICDGTMPAFVHSEAMLTAEMQAQQLRSRLDKAVLQVDVRPPANGSHSMSEPGQNLRVKRGRVNLQTNSLKPTI